MRNETLFIVLYINKFYNSAIYYSFTWDFKCFYNNNDVIIKITMSIMRIQVKGRKKDFGNILPLKEKLEVNGNFISSFAEGITNILLILLVIYCRYIPYLREGIRRRRH